MNTAPFRRGQKIRSKRTGWIYIVIGVSYDHTTSAQRLTEEGDAQYAAKGVHSTTIYIHANDAWQFQPIEEVK